jgi:sugar phosphate isomerase/epimerase
VQAEDAAVPADQRRHEGRLLVGVEDVTLLALKEIDLPNLGVTLDFAHVLYADEQPAFVAAK